ncbi:hypothetical protein ACGF0D_25750 [Kitasatospora sp. NPDC048298]|uniref:DUF7848 domain-containing protein n=1 Tax=Kitasatospora sp. NPDC048298 TaxID=3364049 RepID=UPI0037141FF7
MTEIPNPFLRAGRRIFKFLVWRLGPDPDLEKVHLIFCEGEDENGVPCRANSGECSDLETAKKFPFTHAKVHPEHRSYGRLSYHPMIMAPQEEPA